MLQLKRRFGNALKNKLVQPSSPVTTNESAKNDYIPKVIQVDDDDDDSILTTDLDTWDITKTPAKRPSPPAEQSSLPAKKPNPTATVEFKSKTKEEQYDAKCNAAQRKRNAVTDLSQELIMKQIRLCDDSIEYLELKKRQKTERHQEKIRILKNKI